jgi:hypothetical protein
VVPDLETSDVELKGPLAEIQREPFHQQLVPREDRVAGIAHFAVAWTTPNPFDAVVRQRLSRILCWMRRRRDSWSIELAVRAAISVALELPRREAAEVNLKPLNSRRSAVVGELNLELNLILLGPGRGSITPARYVEHVSRAVRESGWQLSSADYFSGFCTQHFLVGHGESPGSGGVVMPDARRPGRLFASL